MILDEGICVRTIDLSLKPYGGNSFLVDKPLICKLFSSIPVLVCVAL